MAEVQKKRRYQDHHHHHHHKRRRLKKRVFYMLLTTFLCAGVAALISIGTSNIYAVTGKITIFVLAAVLLVLVFFLILYQTAIGRWH